MENCIIYAKKHKEIDKLVNSLKDEFLMEMGDNMSGFLGISIVKDDVK